MLELHKNNYVKIQGIKSAQKTALKVFDYIEKQPIIDIKKASEDLGLSFNTVSKAINNLVGIGVLRQTQSASRNRCFAYEEYLSILRKDT